jgi:hypothetical protein
MRSYRAGGVIRRGDVNGSLRLWPAAMVDRMDGAKIGALPHYCCWVKLLIRPLTKELEVIK